jgi:hypothetical protein
MPKKVQAGPPPLFQTIFSKFTRLQSLQFPFHYIGRSPAKDTIVADTLLSVGLGRLTRLEEMAQYRSVQSTVPHANDWFLKIAKLKELRVLSFRVGPAPQDLSATIASLAPLTRLVSLTLWRDAKINDSHYQQLETTFPNLKLLAATLDQSPFAPLVQAKVYPTPDMLLQIINKGRWFCNFELLGLIHREVSDNFVLELVNQNSATTKLALDYMESNVRIRECLDQPHLRRQLEFGIIQALSTASQSVFELMTSKHKWCSLIIRRALAYWSFADSAARENLILSLNSGFQPNFNRFANDPVAGSRLSWGNDARRAAFHDLLHQSCFQELQSCPTESVPALELRIKRAVLALSANNITCNQLVSRLSLDNRADYYNECLHIGAEAQSRYLVEIGLNGLKSANLPVEKCVNEKRGADALTALQRVFAPCKSRTPGSPIEFSTHILKDLIMNGANVAELTLDGWNLIDLAILTRTEDKDTEIGRLRSLELIMSRAVDQKEKSQALLSPPRRSQAQIFKLFDEIAFYHHPSIVVACQAFSDEVMSNYGFPTKFFDALCRSTGHIEPFTSAAQVIIRRCLEAQKDRLTESDKLMAVQKACRSSLLGLLTDVVRILELDLATIPEKYTWSTVVEFYGSINMPGSISMGKGAVSTVIGADLVAYLGKSVAPSLQLLREVLQSSNHGYLVQTMCDSPKLAPMFLMTETVDIKLAGEPKDRKPNQSPTVTVPLLVSAVVHGNTAVVDAISKRLSSTWTSTKEGYTLLHLCPHGAMVEVIMQKMDASLDINAKSRISNETALEFWGKLYTEAPMTNLVAALFNNVGLRDVDFGLNYQVLEFIPFNPTIADATRRYLLRQAADTTSSIVIGSMRCTKRLEFATHFIQALEEQYRISRLHNPVGGLPLDWRSIITVAIKLQHIKMLKALFSIPPAAQIARTMAMDDEAKSPLLVYLIRNSFAMTQTTGAIVEIFGLHVFEAKEDWDAKDAAGQTVFDVVTKMKSNPATYLKTLIALLQERRTKPAPIQAVAAVGPRKVVSKPVPAPSPAPTPVWKPQLGANPFGASDSSSSAAFAAPTKDPESAPASSASPFAVFSSPTPKSPFSSGGAAPSAFGSPSTVSSPSQAANPFGSSSTTASASPFSSPSVSSNPFSAAVASAAPTSSPASASNPFASSTPAPAAVNPFSSPAAPQKK